MVTCCSGSAQYLCPELGQFLDGQIIGSMAELHLMPNFYWNRFIQKCIGGSVYKYIKNNSYSRDYET
jgi:hypothetical protein